MEVLCGVNPALRTPSHVMRAQLGFLRSEHLNGDQVVELSVLLEVHEKEEEGEDGEGQIEVESERGELKERRTCTWMT